MKYAIILCNAEKKMCCQLHHDIYCKTHFNFRDAREKIYTYKHMYTHKPLCMCTELPRWC